MSPVTPVLVIQGVCPGGSDKRHECKTSLTRAQFEEIVAVLPGEHGSLDQPMSAAAKKQFATQYSHLLVYASEAEKQGLQNTPAGRDMLEYARLQALARLLAYQIRAASQPTQEELVNYYTANQDRYAELTLERVYIPIHPLPEGKTNEPEMRALADELRQRGVSADDFSQLQAEANEKADIKTPPEHRIILPASALPPSQQAVLQLKIGEVSPVILDSTGFAFYKLVAKRTLPFEREASEIQQNLADQKAQKQMDQLVSANKPVLNPQYFPPDTGFGPGHGAHKSSFTLAPPRPYRPPVPTANAAGSN